MQEKEPSILASLGIDPTVITPPPPDHVWDSAVQAAFDPSAVADPDTVPDMDDTPADAPSTDDDLEGLVVDDPDHGDGHTQQAGHTGDAHFGDVPAGPGTGDGGDDTGGPTDSADHGDIHGDDPHLDDTGGYDDHAQHDHDFGQDHDAGHDI
ncbi:hypothetical protein [Gordonia sp. OPL2]|uniref:hypothetical protein n=1 Tax=Gordonia sp. OPL2 TaxID=2486274 RepID=UPI001655A95F|nr:hypothetical protein [Gordonia sp. OPL2]